MSRSDPTEDIRRMLVPIINQLGLDALAEANGDDNKAKEILRARLAEKYGCEADDVYDTGQLQEHFEVEGFGAPFITAIRKADKKKGSLLFVHRPRLYCAFQEA